MASAYTSSVRRWILGAPLRRGAGTHKSADQPWTDEDQFLAEVANEGEAEQIDFSHLERVNEAQHVAATSRIGTRTGRGAHSTVGEEDHLAILSETVTSKLKPVLGPKLAFGCACRRDRRAHCAAVVQVVLLVDALEMQPDETKDETKTSNAGAHLVAGPAFRLMGLQQLLLGAWCCPSWLPVSTPFSPALLRSMTRSCARQVVRRPVVLVGCRAGEH